MAKGKNKKKNNTSETLIQMVDSASAALYEAIENNKDLSEFSSKPVDTLLLLFSYPLDPSVCKYPTVMHTVLMKSVNATKALLGMIKNNHSIPVQSRDESIMKALTFKLDGGKSAIEYFLENKVQPKSGYEFIVRSFSMKRSMQIFKEQFPLKRKNSNADKSSTSDSDKTTSIESSPVLESNNSIESSSDLSSSSVPSLDTLDLSTNAPLSESLPATVAPTIQPMQTAVSEQGTQAELITTSNTLAQGVIANLHEQFIQSFENTLKEAPSSENQGHTVTLLPEEFKLMMILRAMRNFVTQEVNQFLDNYNSYISGGTRCRLQPAAEQAPAMLVQIPTEPDRNAAIQQMSPLNSRIDDSLDKSDDVFGSLSPIVDEARRVGGLHFSFNKVRSSLSRSDSQFEEDFKRNIEFNMGQ